MTPGRWLENRSGKWKELVTKFEEAKKKDPDFAVPPNEDQLLKPAPKLLWQKGQQKWHVDAPVCVAGDKVLVVTREEARGSLSGASVSQLNHAVFSFRAGKIASIVGEMVMSPEMMVRRLREGVEFFHFLREREVAH